MEIDAQEAITTTIDMTRQLGLALFILVVSYIAAKILRGVVHRFAKQRKLPVDITNLLLQISEVGIFLFGLVSALGTLGIDMGAMIAGLGLVGFALGFALKDLLSNFLSGLMILLYSPFVRGDMISVSGSEGTVIEVNLRYTILQSEDKKILIPNSSIFTNIVTVERRIPAN
jgi:small conductance mechanosensitive channel